MAKAHTAIIAIIMLSLSAACAKRNEANAIPRPTAYPRPELYDTVYTATALPANFTVNSQAKLKELTDHKSVTGNSIVWADIEYPAYNATLHCTFTPVTDLNRTEVVANRNERMFLNLGNNIAEQVDITSCGDRYLTSIITTSGSSLTPVQFLSQGEKWVISGALQLNGTNLSADSILPVLQAIKTDIIHTARHLK